QFDGDRDRRPRKLPHLHRGNDRVVVLGDAERRHALLLLRLCLDAQISKLRFGGIPLFCSREHPDGPPAAETQRENRRDTLPSGPAILESLKLRITVWLIRRRRRWRGLVPGVHLFLSQLCTASSDTLPGSSVRDGAWIHVEIDANLVEHHYSEFT